LQLAEPSSFRAKIQNYGALFEGEAAAEVFGDYGVGPNHVLPTEGSARFSGGLSVFNFLRIRTRMSASNSSQSDGQWAESVSNNLIQDVVELARMEGLEAHARAASLRCKPSKRKRWPVA